MKDDGTTTLIQNSNLELKEIIQDNNNELKQMFLDFADHFDKKLDEKVMEVKELIIDLESKINTSLEVLTTDMQIVKKDIKSIHHKLDIHEEQILTHQFVKLEKKDVVGSALTEVQ